MRLASAGAPGRCVSSGDTGLSVAAAGDGAGAGGVGRPRGLLGMSLCAQKSRGRHEAGAVRGSGSGAAGWGCLRVGMSHIEVQLSLQGSAALASVLTLGFCFFICSPGMPAAAPSPHAWLHHPHRHRAGAFLGCTEQKLQLRQD